MGKSADNERIKLRATFYNNLAIGFVITGYAVPYFAFMRKVAEAPTPESLSGLLKAVILNEDAWLLTGIGLWVLLLAWLLRRVANKLITQIED